MVIMEMQLGDECIFLTLIIIGDLKVKSILGGLSFYQINFIAMGITFKIYVFVSKIN